MEVVSSAVTAQPVEEPPWSPDRRSIDGSVPLEHAGMHHRAMPRGESGTRLELLAPLELGAKLERRARLSMKSAHVVGRAVLLVRAASTLHPPSSQRHRLPPSPSAAHGALPDAAHAPPVFRQ